MKLKNEMTAITAVIRTYNNALIAEQVQNLLEIGVGGVIVVVNSIPDKKTTSGYLAGLINDPRLRVEEMTEGYTWSSALNRALMIIHTDNMIIQKDKMTTKSVCRYVFNVSVEAKFSGEHLQAMLTAINRHPRIGVVGTSFRGIQNGVTISLGQSYKHPRNTGMLIRVNVMGPGFDTYCDGIGGMEDIDFMLRMLALYGMQVQRLDLQVPLIVGNNYHQPSKEAREQEAMDNIVSRWRESLPDGTKERVKIEEYIAQMGIASSGK